MSKIDLTYIKKFEECTRNKEVDPSEQLKEFVYKLDELKITLIKLNNILEKEKE